MNNNTVIYAILLQIPMFAGAVWSVVEFLLYLVKDDPFNWWSVAVFVIGLLVAAGAFKIPSNEG